MDARKSLLFLTLFACLFLSACAPFHGIFEPVRDAQGQPTGAVQPSHEVIRTITETGSAFGPFGQLGAGAAVLALQAGALLMSQRSLKKHETKFHDQPARKTNDAPG